MTGEIELAADVVTGAAIARAVEPSQGEAAQAVENSVRNCLNCTAPLAGAYCAQCGQSAKLHRSVLALWHDFLHSVLHLEGKIWRTLPELAFRPGRLTRRYIWGERAKFVSPFALFLFSVVLLLAIASIGNEEATIKEQDLAVQKTTLAGAEQALAGAKQTIEQAEKNVADVRSQLDAAGLTAEQTAGIGEADWERRFNAWVTRIAENPDFFAYQLKTNAYKFSWVLILISVPFVWLLFPFSREYGLYEHSVFVTYSITFASLLFALLTALSELEAARFLTGTLFSWALFAVVPLHMYSQLKDTYSLSWSGALLRLPLLYLFAGISAGLFFALLLGLA